MVRVIGRVAEWLMAAVLKTARVKALVGSNPTSSASLVAAPRSKPEFRVDGKRVGDVAKITAVDISKEMILFEKMPNGLWRMIYTASIADGDAPSMIAVLK